MKSTDPNCTLCRLMVMDAQSPTSTVSLFAAAQEGWTLGEHGFKQALCTDHQALFGELKRRANARLASVRGQITK